VSNGITGFSISDEKGAWSGFDVDFCRAVASAIFGDATKVQFVPVKADERFAALKENKFDLLSRNSTWSFSDVEVEQGLLFAGVTYYDRARATWFPKNVKLPQRLNSTAAKFASRTAQIAKQMLQIIFESNRMKFEPIRFETMKEIIDAYQANKCDVISSDVSQLYAERLGLTKPNENAILADVISKEPLGPAVRQGDDQWLNLVKWVNIRHAQCRRAWHNKIQCRTS